MQITRKASRIPFTTACIFFLGLLFFAIDSYAAATWTAAGTMNSARKGHTATLLPNGRVLVVGGVSGSLYFASAEIHNPDNGTWTATGNMNNSRESHTATLLPNGKVLVAGGYNSGSSFLASVEIYDPALGTWTATGTMNSARHDHTAILLPNGRVLAVGGGNGSGLLASAETYNPDNGTWTAAGTMNSKRYYHTATLLPNGRVLVAGGSDAGGSYLASAEIYDPVSGTWTATGTMNSERYSHSATLLPSGRVLVAGGSDGSVHLASAEIYNPDNDTWASAGTMNSARGYHTTTLLPNGKVLVGGGSDGSGSLASVEIYNPDNGTWTATGTMKSARNVHTATLLPDGRVLVAGGSNGFSLASAEIYDPVSGTWTATGTMNSARREHTATLLPNGKVLVAGGFIYSGSSYIYLASTEIYNPDNGTWTEAGTMNSARYFHTATLLPNGKVLVAGGFNNGSSLASAEIYDPALGMWTATGTMKSARRLHTATLLPNGRVLIAGGNKFDSLASTEIYNPDNGTWTATGTMNSVRDSHTATLLPNGKVLVAGGYNSGSNSILAGAEIYNPDNGTWTATGTMNDMRDSHTATLLPNGKVIVAGGSSASGYFARAEIYDPAPGTWEATGTMNSLRGHHTATLLPNGKVLVAGAYRGGSFYLASAEMYDPALRTWMATGTMNSARGDHTATLLLNGRVLVAGGFDGSFYLASAEIYDSNLGFDETWRPVINVVSPLDIAIGYPLTLTGSRFRGISQASSGTTSDSPTNYPLVQLERIDNGQTQWLLPDLANPFSETTFSSGPLEGILAGPAMVTVFVNGIPSKAKIIVIAPSYDLNVLKAGLGAGMVISTPEGIDCGSTCSFSSFLFRQNTSVTLTATPDTGCAFTGWNGDGCSGIGTCTVTMDKGKNVTAQFSCTYNLSPSSASIPPDAYAGSFEVTTGDGCSWTATSSSWITITSEPPSGTGNGTVSFSVSQNNGSAARNGSIMVGGQSFAVHQDARFTDDGGGTVSDNITGLEWYRDANYLGMAYSWDSALQHVESLNSANGGDGTNGHNDWRLPTIGELAGMIGVGEPFTNVQPDAYWSSTTYKSQSKSSAWTMNFGTDLPGNDGKTNDHFFWPVRSGDNSTFKTIKVIKNGTGDGEVKSLAVDYKLEVLCDPVCFTSIDNATVTLTAEALDSTTAFEGWGEDNCDIKTPDNACIVTMDRACTVVAKFKDLWAEQNHKAIIVAGSGNYDGNNLWDMTDGLTKKAYLVLLNQRYTHDRIYYLTFNEDIDVDGDNETDCDNETSRDRLYRAIMQWAADADSLTIYLMGHGRQGSFEIDGVTGIDQFLTADELRQWLDDFQTAHNIPVTVIYEACYSGSFIKLLKPGDGLGDRQRIVIASAGENQKAWFNGAASFSYYFWDMVLDGKTVAESFIRARDNMAAPGYQVACMDADKDGVNDNGSAPSGGYIIGKGIINAAIVPEVIGIMGEHRIYDWDNRTVEITIDSIDPPQVLIKYATIKGPDVGSGVDERAITDLPILVFGSGGFSVTYDQFTDPGIYTIAVYAIDFGGAASDPAVTYVVKDIDAFEEDDEPEQANPIVVNEDPGQFHNFWDTGDEDWVKFYGMKGKAGSTSQSYQVDIGTHGPLCNAVLGLYGPDDPYLFIKEVNNGSLNFDCTQDGIYYVHVSQPVGASYGKYTNYYLKVWNTDAPVLGLIKGSIRDTGGSPVPNAVITTDYGYSALGSNGSYEMPHKGGGPFTLEAEADGYQPYSQSGINLADRSTLQLNIVMTPTGGGTTTTVPGGEGETTTTTTATGGGSSTTTTTIRRLCPARQALGDGSEAELEALRSFRDARLAKSAEGAKLVSMYYRHAAELTLMFERRPDIAAQVRELVLELLPQLGTHQKLVLSQDMKQQILGLIDELRTDASQGLKKSLRLVRKQIEKGELPDGPSAVLQ